jgi:DNA-binding XRE family transcriptional regulator
MDLRFTFSGLTHKFKDIHSAVNMTQCKLGIRVNTITNTISHRETGYAEQFWTTKDIVGWFRYRVLTIWILDRWGPVTWISTVANPPAVCF